MGRQHHRESPIVVSPSRSQSIFFNSTALIAATLLTRAFSVPVAALLVRRLEPAVVGEYFYLTGLVALFAPLVTLGAPLYLAREVVQQPERAPLLLKTAYLLQAAVGVGTIALFVAADPAGLLGLCALGMVAQATAGIFQYAIIGLGRGYLASALQAVGSLIGSVSLLAVLLWSPSLTAVIWQFALAGLAQHALGYFALRRFCPELRFDRRRPTTTDYRSVLWAALPNGLLLVLATLYFRIDTALLAVWGNLLEVARYGAAFKFIELVVSLVGVVSWVFFAEFSNMYARGDTQMVRVARRGLRYMLLACLPLAAVIAFFARDILYLFYGNEYLASTPTLQILAWTTVFLFGRELLGSLLQAHNRVRVQVVVYGASLAINVALNWYWIPRSGGLGAAAATLLSEVFNCLAFGWFCYRRFGLQPLERSLLPIAQAFAAMLFVFWLLEALPAPLSAISGLAVFIGVFFSLGGLNDEDLGLWRQVLTRLGRKRMVP
ncbi:MAG: flippase [Gemmatimonadaceae bacterium]|nr:flippase [Gloeobacterales cyanobacterium ES-bin-141]